MVFDPSHNPYIEKCKEYKDWLIDETETNKYRGFWRKVLKREKLTVEIGPGNGWFLIDYLRKNPEEGYIAIEKQYKRSVKCAEKLRVNSLINAKVIRGKGELLKEYFNDGEINKIVINFPTPWVKERHKKRILFSNVFVGELSKVLKDGGEFFLKSDHREYIGIVVEKLVALNFSIKNRDNYEFETTYERKWRDEGREIFIIHAIKNNIER